MKIAILGYGIQGQSALRYWDKGSDEITICDRNDDLEIPADVKSKLGTNYLSGLDEFDLLVRSPNVHPRDIVVANQPEILSKVTTPTNEFMRVSPTKHVIGVTGTKGKGTTSSLIVEILKASGKKVHLGGNFGISPLDLLTYSIDPEDWVVLELANFQLIDLSYSPHIAVCLMISPEHLDWHEGMQEYVTAKKQMFVNQKSDDKAIYYAKNDLSKQVASEGNGQKIPFYEEPGAVVKSGKFEIEGHIVCDTRDIKLLGEHNWQNICAAITTTWQITKDIDNLRSATKGFKGLDNRLELVRELNGVKYYNDSFGSAPDATIAAIKAIDGPKIVIIGGFDRNLPLEPLTNTIKAHANELKTVVLIGASLERVSNELTKAGFSNFQTMSTKDLREIVRNTQKIATTGDSVILSPGFPSFDMFKDFEDRGHQFKESVNSL